MSTQNIVSVSGGKDSTATLLVAIALDTPNLQAVFADTGNEHEQTYEYLDYLALSTGVTITRVKADFTQRIEGKRGSLKPNGASKALMNRWCRRHWMY